jgi:membrane peptidoglycan carboxypeptidase
VGEAARTYFNTTPALLSPLQAYYVISLLPKPKVMHFEKDGRVSRGWLNLLHHLVTIANKRHYLTDEELKAALQEDLRFGVPDSGLNISNSTLPEHEPDAMMEVNDTTEQ